MSLEKSIGNPDNKGRKRGYIMDHIESMEDYLERLLMLEEAGNKEIHAVDIANSIGFSKPSVSIAMKKLEAQGYVVVGPKMNLILTESGRAIASKVYERHKILSAIFVSLGVPEEVALEDACKVEHDLSNKTFAALKEHYEKNLSEKKS